MTTRPRVESCASAAQPESITPARYGVVPLPPQPGLPVNTWGVADRQCGGEHVARPDGAGPMAFYAYGAAQDWANSHD
jgi:hypothetical protein